VREALPEARLLADFDDVALLARAALDEPLALPLLLLSEVAMVPPPVVAASVSGMVLLRCETLLRGETVVAPTSRLARLLLRELLLLLLLQAVMACVCVCVCVRACVWRVKILCQHSCVCVGSSTCAGGVVFRSGLPSCG
jgi:hypothetical protein